MSKKMGRFRSGFARSGIQNISEHGLVLDDLAYITHKVHHELLGRSQLVADDLLMTITGRIGTASLVKPDHLPANINQHIVRIRLKTDEVLPAFIREYLNTDTGRLFSNRGVTGTTRTALDYEAIRSLPVCYPPLKIQRALVSEMETARASRKAKLAEAEALLSGLDAFLLEQLGLTTKKKEISIVFAARLGDAWNRCDADYHSPRFEKLRESIENCGYTVMNLKDIRTSIRTGFAAGREVQAFDDKTGIPHIRPLNMSPFGELSFEGTKRVPKQNVQPHEIIQQGEVLLNNTNSTEWVGKTTVFESNRPCCCSNHVTRIITKDIVIPWFLASLLNAIRSTGYLGLLATNFVYQAGINTQTLDSLRLPIPNKKKQQAIVKEIKRRKKEAWRLREETDREWEAAKARFEAKLLGKEAV